MFDLLLEGIAWVTLSFDDKSVRVIKTTLSEKILSEFGVKAKPGYFYDLKHGEYVPFEEHPVTIKATKIKPRLSFLNTHHIPFYIDFAGLFILLQKLQ